MNPTHQLSNVMLHPGSFNHILKNAMWKIVPGMFWVTRNVGNSKKNVSVKYNNLRSPILKDLNNNTRECARKCKIACAYSTPYTINVREEKWRMLLISIRLEVGDPGQLRIQVALKKRIGSFLFLFVAKQIYVLSYMKVLKTHDIWIWANQPIHLFLVGCLNPCLQGTNVQVGSTQP